MASSASIFAAVLKHAKKLSRDPLQAVLILIVLLQELPRAINELSLELADGFAPAFEGGFVRVPGLREPKHLSQQLVDYLNYIELLFSPNIVEVD